jgi:hypothetical protein
MIYYYKRSKKEMNYMEYIGIPMIVLTIIAGILKFKYIRSRNRQLNETEIQQQSHDIL